MMKSLWWTMNCTPNVKHIRKSVSVVQYITFINILDISILIRIACKYIGLKTITQIEREDFRKWWT